jgi:hypothetical protein
MAAAQAPTLLNQVTVAMTEAVGQCPHQMKDSMAVKIKTEGERKKPKQRRRMPSIKSVMIFRLEAKSGKEGE